jgi:hypothetical protein
VPGRGAARAHENRDIRSSDRECARGAPLIGTAEIGTSATHRGSSLDEYRRPRPRCVAPGTRRLRARSTSGNPDRCQPAGRTTLGPCQHRKPSPHRPLPPSLPARPRRATMSSWLTARPHLPRLPRAAATDPQIDGLQVNAVLGFATCCGSSCAITPEDQPTTYGRFIRNTFRELYADYKAHRPPAPDDLILQFDIVAVRFRPAAPEQVISRPTISSRPMCDRPVRSAPAPPSCRPTRT